MESQQSGDIIVYNCLDLQVNDTIKVQYIDKYCIYMVITKIAQINISGIVLHVESIRDSSVTRPGDTWTMAINGLRHSSRVVLILERPGVRLLQEDFLNEI